MKDLFQEVGMIKKIALVLLIVGVCIGCTACQYMSKINGNEPVEPASFFSIEEYAYGRVVVDGQTGVMYWMSVGPQNRGTLTLLVDEAGKPRIFEGR